MTPRKGDYEAALNNERSRYRAMYAHLTAEVQRLQELVQLVKDEGQEALEQERAKAEKELEKSKKEWDRKEKSADQQIKSLQEALAKEQASHQETKERHALSQKRRIEQQVAQSRKTPRVGLTQDGTLNKHDLKWKTFFEQLQAFRTVHGHCNVPRQRTESTETNLKKLGEWVDKQRYHRNQLRKGKKSPMTRERIRLLDELGFQWQLVPMKLTFEQRLAQLSTYQETYGNCNVPEKENPDRFPSGLGEWVRRLRKGFKKGKLDQERIDALESLGFQWRLRDRSGTESAGLDDEGAFSW